MVLGRLYEQGLGVKQDMAKALAYFDLANKQIHEPYAFFKIGQYLEEGAHPECYKKQPNRDLALKYFRDANKLSEFQSQSGLKEALFKIGQYA